MTAQPPPRVAYPLWPKQMVAMDAIWLSGVNQMLYGGAAGPGKSYFQRALAFHCANVWPGARIAIFRDNFTQLFKTQVWFWWREMHRLGFPVKQHWNQTNAEWRFPNPYTADTVVEFLHIDQSIGAEKWLSAEWAALLPDEASQIDEDDLRLLYSRVRANAEQKTLWRQLADEREAQVRALGLDSEWDIKRARSDYRPLAVFATNPGGASAKYFKTEFIDASLRAGEQPWTVREDIVLDGKQFTVETKRHVIRGKLTDNPSIDPVQYAATLVHLPPHRREQLLNGDWDTFEGKTFTMLDENLHLIDARRVFGGKLTPPTSWPRIAGLDHGTTNPTAAEWTARDEDGFFITYLEYYSPGPVGQHIRGIKERMVMDGALDLIFEADPRMWHKTKGLDRMYSVADEYAWGGAPPERPNDYTKRGRGVTLRQAKIERVAGREALQRLLEPVPDLTFPDWHPNAGLYGSPRLFIAKQCPELWRELNGIRTDPNNPEETVKEDDHCLVGSTLVDTESGPTRIDDLAGTTGRVWGYDGRLHRYQRARRTHEDTTVMRLTTEDGRSVVATPGHRFLMDDGSWRGLRDIRAGERLFDTTTTVRYTLSHERDHHLALTIETRDDPCEAGVSRRDVLPLRVLLPVADAGWPGAPPSQGLGGAQRPDTGWLGCASQDRSRPQRDRRFGVFASSRSSLDATRRSALASQHASTSGPPRESEEDRGLAPFAGRAGMARRTRNQSWRKAQGVFASSVAIPVPNLRQVIRDEDARYCSGLLEGLPSQGGQRVARVERAGKADVYNIAVDDVFSFSVAGGIIVHNSYDSLYRSAGIFEQRLLASRARGPRRTLVATGGR